jgi:hypothetical protein
MEQLLLQNQVVFNCTKKHIHTHTGAETFWNVLIACSFFFSGLKSGKFGSPFSLQNRLWRLKDAITIRHLLVGKACNNHKFFFFPLPN